MKPENADRDLSKIDVSLAEAEKIINWLADEILMTRIKSPYQQFFFESQIPADLIDGQLAFARIDIDGEIFRITFHRYPPEIEAEVANSKVNLQH
jgi:hypothetical protein